MDIIPINLDDLIHARSVEDTRIEYKAAWNDHTRPAIVKTICAFANDLLNLNGGYVILGIEAPDGVPILPPRGIDPARVEDIHREIRVACQSIDPEYQPVIEASVYMERTVMILWAPAGDSRPYQAPHDRRPRERCYFVRQGPETIKAQGEILRQLVELTARTPFDDRRNQEASVLDLSPILVKRYLQEVNSDLLNHQPPLSDIDLYKALRIVVNYGETCLPRNVGLLFFNERPHRFFRGTAFEVVQFGDDAGGNLIEETKFEGPLNTTVVEVVDYLDNLTSVQLRKLPGRAAVERAVAYPYEALEEAITNAAYHRSYESANEPNKVYLYPDRMEIISYPGPVAGLTVEHLQNDAPIPPFPARNRRIGEFLKELRLAEMRGTGIPKIRRTMSENGSPAPSFDFTESYFRVVLPAHPQYVLVHALRESTYLWSIGERSAAVEKLKGAFEGQPGSGAIVSQLLEYLHGVGEQAQIEEAFATFHSASFKTEAEQPYLRYVKLLIGDGARDRAQQIMECMPEDFYYIAPVDVAIAFKRLKIYDKAHTIFSRAYEGNETNSQYLHNYAQTKMAIANELAHRRNPQWSAVRRLRRDAVELLRRAISVSTDSTQTAWIWFDLARTLSWQRSRRSEIREAYENAIAILPHERAFRESYDKWRSSTQSR